MPAFFFYGDDTYSMSQKIAHWKIEFEKKYGDLNTSLFEGSQYKPAEIIDCAQSMPFLAEKRLVIVKNTLNEFDSESLEPVGEFVTNVPDTTIVIFAELRGVDKRLSLYKKLIKNAQCTEFKKIEGKSLTQWIAQHAKKCGGEMDTNACQHLADIVGGDLFRLENEVVKLVNYAANRPVTVKDVDKMVVSTLTTSIFKLTDALSQKNNKTALTELHTLIESGEELHGILFMIMRQFRIITEIKDLSDRKKSREEIVGLTKEHPFVVSNTLAQTRNFSMSQLKKAYDLLLDIDTRLKTGGIKVTTGDNREFMLALDRLVVELCR